MPPRRKAVNAKPSNVSKARKVSVPTGTKKRYRGLENSTITSPPCHEKRVSIRPSRPKQSEHSRPAVRPNPKGIISDSDEPPDRHDEVYNNIFTETKAHERQRWRICTRYYQILSEGSSASISRNRVAKEYDTSPATVSRILRKWNNGESLERRKGSGRKRTIDLQQVLKFLRERANECHYCFSTREMGTWVKEEFGSGSARFVRELMKEEGWYKTRQRTKPILTEDHRRARLK
tara:strand:+ start:1356 stop:2057 length:702 start_codon:yes stop_codon:yes gene_type:complete